MEKNIEDFNKKLIHRNNNEEISLQELIQKAKACYYLLLNKWKVVILFTILSASIGYVISLRSSITYTAEITYTLEENQNSNNNFGLLASQLGINNPSTNSSGGIFTGANLIDLMKSRLLFEKILLKPVLLKNKKISIAEYYLKIRRNKDPNYLSNFNFDPNENASQYSIEKRAALNEIYQTLTSEKSLSFNNKESKSSLLRLSVTSENEEFAIFFCKYLMNATSEFYIETKTKKALNNVDKLRNQVDSVRSLFNISVSKYATATDEIYNLNPALKSKGTKPIKSQIDVEANTTLLTSLITNLEIAKSTLNNQTPLFQIIDEPIAPLTQNSLNKTKATIIGGFLGFFFITSILLTIAFFKNTI